MYDFSLIIMIVCSVLLILGFVWYTRFQWVFWVYCGDGNNWFIPLLVTLFFMLLYGQFIWCFGESNENFFSSGLKWLSFSLIQIIFFAGRWADLAEGRLFWERHGRKALSLFILGAICLRLVFVVSADYRVFYQWNNAEPHEIDYVGKMDFTGTKAKRIVKLDDGREIATTDTKVSVGDIVRLYGNKVFSNQKPQSSLEKGWNEISAAIERKKARKAAERR